MIKSNIITPIATKGWASRDFDKGVSNYDLDNLYSPDNALNDSCVLDLASPKFTPDNTYAFDRSKYNNHGTITGATWERLPSGLWAKSLDNVDDVVSISDNSSIQLTNALSYLAWIQFNANQGSDIISKAVYNTSGYEIYINGDISGNQLVLRTDKAGSTGITRATPVLTLNVWHFIAVAATFPTTAQANLFYDGVLQTNLGEVGPHAVLVTGTTNLTIGKGPVNNQPGNYRITLERLFNTEITAGKIAELFNRERHLFGV